MAFTEWLVILSAALSALAAGLAFLAYRAAGRSQGSAAGDLPERIAVLHEAVQAHPRTLREETQSLREEHGRQAQQLREEVTRLVTGFQTTLADRFDKLGETQAAAATTLRKELTDGQTRAGEVVDASTKRFGDFQKERLDRMADQLKALQEAAAADQKAMRESLQAEIGKLRAENTVELDKMRATVDEKLQSTLEKRFTDSFALVTERLDQVHKGLGEMQNLATGVGDLKRVLTDVRQRGAWGEVQLGGLLEDMLTPEQFERQVKVRKGSDERVDFAIKLPHDDGVLLPIDCKFPQEDYDRLLHAHNGGDPAAVEAAVRALEATVRRQAKSIEEKYVHPPGTTNFAIMYLPTEGLFAEVVRRPGLAAELQQKYRVTVTGPTTLAAVLNSLRMGFTSLTIQKRSSEVWSVLGAVKGEFEKYEGLWEKVANQLSTASNTVELARKKTGTIASKLRNVQSLESPQTSQPALLEMAGLPGEEPAAQEPAA